jgi:quercetin dioxygenase-like cupin family protein
MGKTMQTTFMRRAVGLALAVIIGLGAAPAQAGGPEASQRLARVPDECPPDKVLKTKGQIEWKDDTGVRRKLLAIIDLTGWRNIGNLRMRTRRLTVPPGGIIPTHEHNDRPSLVFFVKGDLIEHNNVCAVPIVHHQGTMDIEWGDYAHWWENKTKSDVVLIGTDIVSPDFLDNPATDEKN